MTFLDFVKKNAKRNDPVGDYCADTLRMLKLHPNRSYKTKKDFQSLFGLCRFDISHAEEAFKEAWEEYRK